MDTADKPRYVGSEFNCQHTPITNRRFPVYLLFNVNLTMKVMQEELFGPILPILTYQSFNEALHIVNSLPNPLVLYYFGNNQTEIDELQYKTLSGALSINDAVTYAGIDDLPFGGVGHSGMGQYHAEEGFNTFSKLKPVMIQRKFSLLSWFYPPYGKSVRWFLNYIGGIKLS